MRDKINELSRKIFPKVKEIREHIHRNPELSWKEHKTSKYIQERLDEIGVSYSTGWAETGIVATINDSGPCIALRADMDALPIQEQNECSYKSEVDGVMHACGHDVHTACMIGVAQVLNELKSDLKGQFKLIFQPAEEKLPGGASVLIKEGVLQNPVPELIIGQHVHPSFEVGSFGFKEGQYMASADELYITIIGKGGHAALPHLTKDPILAGAAVVQALQHLVSRRNNPIFPMVLTIGKFNSEGGATNVIPAEVKMEGTLRCMNEALRREMWDAIVECTEHTAKSYGLTASVEIKKGYPCLVNHVEWTRRLFADAKAMDPNVEELPIRMTAEDFSYYSHEIPAVFYRLGVGNKEKGIVYNVHHPRFDIDSEALYHGVRMMSYLAYKAAAATKIT